MGHNFSTDGHNPEEITCGTPPEEGAIYGINQLPSQCLGRYTAYTTLPGIASIQTSPTTLTPSTVPTPIPAKTLCAEEDLPARPCPAFSSQINIRDSTSSPTKPPQAPSPPELSGFKLPNRQPREQESLASLLQIQQQVCDCSEEILQPHPSHQDHSRALGRLFCATDRFIFHISGNYTSASSSTHISGPQSSAISNRANSSSTHSPFLNPSIISHNQKQSLGSSHHTSPSPSTAVFYIIMACHARILAAYDAITSITPSATIFPCQFPTRSTTGECCFSLGSFTVRPGTSLESLLHLQVISHQLDHLNSALNHYMLTDAASLSPLSSRLGPSRSSSSPLGVRSSDSLQDFAVQVVEQQGMALKRRIVARIEECGIS